MRDKKHIHRNFFTIFKALISQKIFLIYLILSANIFKFLKLISSVLLVFQRKHSVFKISRSCTFFNKIYVPNRELHMPVKVLLAFHILSIFKTTQKYICILGKLTNKYKIVSNEKG